MLDPLSFTHGAVALGIGMLVGLVRERRKGQGRSGATHGLRSFAAAALLGFTSMALLGPVLVGVMGIALCLLLCVSYHDQPWGTGITGEIAMLLVLLLGALSATQPELAAAVGVVMTILLALRDELHRFVLQQLSETEVRDGLILLTVALVVLPLTPNRFIGPFEALNPRTICTLTLLLMGVEALGHIALRMTSARYGIALGAIASGFASGAATIAVIGRQAKAAGNSHREYAAAAVLSNLATIVQFALVLIAIDARFLTLVWPSMLLGGTSAAAFGLGLIAPWQASSTDQPARSNKRVFNLKGALVITVVLTGISLLSSALLHLAGDKGVIAIAFVSGLGDAHAAIASIASLVASGQMSITQLAPAALTALSGNTLSKCLLSWWSGGAAYGKYVTAGQLLVLASFWLGLFV